MASSGAVRSSAVARATVSVIVPSVEARRAETAKGSTASSLRRKMLTVFRLLRQDPARLRRRLIRVEHSLVYTRAPEELALQPGADARLIKLSDRELEDLVRREPQYAPQLQRRLSLGFNSAYGLEVDGIVQHVCWLIDDAQDSRTRRRKVKLRPGEAEITHCFTPAEYRGHGVYARAIHAVCSVAVERKIERVFMITSASNAASQAGILKAGLHRRGSIWHVWLGERLNFVLRGHRWPRVRRMNDE
jgi:hypothetical protein